MRKSDWSVVSSLYATHGEDCQEDNKATMNANQNNCSGSRGQRRNDPGLCGSGPGDAIAGAREN